MTTTALIVAAGRGHRAGSDVPKQYATVGGTPILRQCLQTFATLDLIDHLQVVIHPDDSELYRTSVG